MTNSKTISINGRTCQVSAIKYRYRNEETIQDGILVHDIDDINHDADTIYGNGCILDDLDTADELEAVFQNEFGERVFCLNPDGIYTLGVYPGDVINASGSEVNFDSAVALMDDDLREQLHAEGYETEQAFFSAYEKAHAAKYGEPWELSKANPVY